ncbi:MAG TPA: IS1380 family transposase [Planctomycetota bacterium]
MTECNQRSFDFHSLGRRAVVGRFDGGNITSDAGAALLREVELRTGIIRQFAACFTDHRDPERIEHLLFALVAQRVYGLALGYEDLNDHDELRADPLMAVLVGHSDPLGESRVQARDRGKALAGKSTLNRLELTPADASAASRYKKIVYHRTAIEDLFVDLFLQALATPPSEIVLDLDATDDPIHGQQQGRFFHGYYKEYCYLPLYIFCGEHLLCARLRPANIDGAAGALKQLRRIVARIRQRWPQTRIILRGDSGFCREHLMTFCEDNGLYYIFGLARNVRLEQELAPEMERAKQKFEAIGKAARVFKDFVYQTLKTWRQPRRVVGKAEHLEKGANPRFVVSNLPLREQDARTLYEDTYCARGEMENRIKEQQLYLFADRTSAATMRANQLRLWFSSIAYVLMHALRRLGLHGTDLEHAQCQTIRLKLLKIGAQIKVSVRCIWLSLAAGYPLKQLLSDVYQRLRAIPLRC